MQQGPTHIPCSTPHTIITSLHKYSFFSKISSHKHLCSFTHLNLHTRRILATTINDLGFSSSFSYRMRSALLSYAGYGEPHFLEACNLCSKPLGDNSDIFMYRYKISVPFFFFILVHYRIEPCALLFVPCEFHSFLGSSLLRFLTQLKKKTEIS